MEADHYDVLGVPHDADLAQIKRNYRQLVRQNHPDAAPSQDKERAHQQMLKINRAWSVLSDSTARTRYDLSRQIVIHAPRRADFTTSSTRNAAPRASNPPRTTNVSPPNGAPNSTKTARSATTAKTSRPKNARPSAASLREQIGDAAQAYFFYGRMGEAISICRRVLDLDADNAEAHALLGDIYRDQQRTDAANFHYERAAQSQPQNLSYREKWQQNLERSHENNAPDFSDFKVNSPLNSASNNKTASQNGAPKTPKVAAEKVAPTPNSVSGSVKSSTRNATTIRHFAGANLVILAAILALLGHVFPGAEIESWSPVAAIEGQLLLFLTLGVGALGAALPLLDQIELCDTFTRPNSASISSLGGASTLVLVTIAAILFSPLGWAIAIFLSLATRRANTSLFFCLALSVLLSGTLSLPSRGVTEVPTLHDALFWWSGRALFPVLMAGWALGSLWPRRTKEENFREE